MLELIIIIVIMRGCWVLSTALLEIVQVTPTQQISHYGMNEGERRECLTKYDYFNCCNMFKDPFSILSLL